MMNMKHMMGMKKRSRLSAMLFNMGKRMRMSPTSFHMGKLLGMKQGMWRKQHLDNRATFLGGLGLGSLIMYLFDPDRGKRRLSLIRDKAVKAASRSGRMVTGAGEDLRNRAKGVAAETRSRVSKKTSAREEREHEAGK